MILNKTILIDFEYRSTLFVITNSVLLITAVAGKVVK